MNLETYMITILLISQKSCNFVRPPIFLQLIVDNEIYMYNDLTGQVEQVYSPTLRAISPSPGSGMGSSMGMADGMPYASTPQFGSQLSLRAPSPGSAPADVPNRTKRAGARGREIQ